MVHCIDMPIQHLHDCSLERMGRRMDETEIRELFARMRERLPDLVSRTTTTA